jgi:hypothetical protein
MTMAERMTVSWRGRTYEVARQTGREAAPDGGAVWQVTQDGALITSFPATDGEGSGAVREKVVGWLEANADRPPADVGRQ